MKAEIFDNVCYGTAERQILDIAFPVGAKGDVSLLLMVHGGGWSAGDKGEYHNEIIKLAESGLVAAAMNYRYVSEESDCFDILDDITSALNRIKKMGTDRGINVNKMLMTGLSAGAHLSLLYSYSKYNESPVRPAAVVALSGPTDMVSDEAVEKFVWHNQMGNSDEIFALLSKFLGVKVDQNTAKTEKAYKLARQLSPLYYVNENTVPTIICHAINDAIVPFCNAVALEKALTENGVTHEFIEYPTSGHVLEKDPECSARAVELSKQYIEKYLDVFKNRIEITDKELNERIRLSHKRLSEPFYGIENVFADEDAKWPGDKEGRALLAFVSLVCTGEEKIPCMELMIEKLPEMLNRNGYLGKITEEFFEQQLSGHSWLLRGLSAYYEKYGKAEILPIINGIVENLYMPLKGKICDYPLLRNGDLSGGVDGHTSETCGGWLLSTDTCCAFMSIDGLSHVYRITKDTKILSLLDEMIDTFMKIDKQKIKAQTHCTLTAARGMVRLYSLTENKKYLENAQNIFRLYTDYGMTYTYENFNWWGRPETWTEPCAIIDSLMLAGELYKITGSKEYRTLAARIYHNGFATFQRPNGGAGTQKIVCETNGILRISGYEAPQCCTMRLGEGLRYIRENREFLYAETTGEIAKDEKGIYRDGDIIYAKTCGDSEHGLHPLIKYYKLTDEEVYELKQQIVF